MAPPLRAATALASLALGVVAGGGALPGVADQAALLQTSARAAGSDLSDLQAAARGQLGSFLESREVQDLLKEHSRSDEDMAEDLRSLAQVLRVSKETEARLELEAQHAPAAPVAPPPEVELLKEDMRAALRQLAPDPAHMLMLLQQPRIGRDLKLSQEAQDSMSEHIARLSKSFQADTALHEELLARIPHLHGLIADSWFLEPLWAAGNASAGRELRGRELADRLPELAGRGVAALKSVRMEGGRAEAGGFGEEGEAAAEGTIPYLNVVTGHAITFSPASKVGCGVKLQVGANKKFFGDKTTKALDKPEPDYAALFKGFFINPSVTLACNIGSGQGMSATFELNIMDIPPPVQDVSNKGPDAFPTLRFYAVALGITTGGPAAGTASGVVTTYSTGSMIGGGMKLTPFADPALFVEAADLCGDLMHSFDFASGKGDSPGGGWSYGVNTAFALVARPPAERKSTLAKVIFGTKTVYAPAGKKPTIGMKFVKSAGGGSPP